jgi:hypothetical protein
VASLRAGVRRKTTWLMCVRALRIGKDSSACFTRQHMQIYACTRYCSHQHHRKAKPSTTLLLTVCQHDRCNAGTFDICHTINPEIDPLRAHCKSSSDLIDTPHHSHTRHSRNWSARAVRAVQLQAVCSPLELERQGCVAVTAVEHSSYALLLQCSKDSNCAEVEVEIADKALVHMLAAVTGPWVPQALRAAVVVAGEAAAKEESAAWSVRTLGELVPSCCSRPM